MPLQICFWSSFHDFPHFSGSLNKTFSFQIAIADADSPAQLVPARVADAVDAKSNF